MTRRATASLLASAMFGTIDSNALVPIIAYYAHYVVGADLVQTGIIVALFSVVHAPANLFFGRIADRFGRKLPLQVGLLWDAVSLFLYSLAPTPLLLALVRISHGIGSGLVGPIVDRLGYTVLFYLLSGSLLLGFGFSMFVREPPRSPAKPLPWTRLLRYAVQPAPAAGYASIFSLYFILGAFVTLVPLHLKDELGYTPLAIGLR